VNRTPVPVLDAFVGHVDEVQPALPLASFGVRRWVWQSRFGAILIEVIGNDVFVNGQRVERVAP